MHTNEFQRYLQPMFDVFDQLCNQAIPSLSRSLKNNTLMPHDCLLMRVNWIQTMSHAANTLRCGVHSTLQSMQPAPAPHHLNVDTETPEMMSLSMCMCCCGQLNSSKVGLVILPAWHWPLRYACHSRWT